MGQYHIIVNQDKGQFIYGHAFGDGIKLLEFGNGKTMTALALLLAADNGLGGGDLNSVKSSFVGSWAGDRIIICGDYADNGKDLPEGAAPYFNLYSYAFEYYEDISCEVAKLMTTAGELHSVQKYLYEDDERPTGMLTFEQAYVVTHTPELPYIPKMAAIQQMEIGDEVVTWFNNEQGSVIRKILKIEIEDKHYLRGIVRITLDGGKDNLPPLENLHATYVIPLKHGLFLDLIKRI